MTNKIYISGKISGIEDEAILLFEEAEREISTWGDLGVNPMNLNHEDSQTWVNYMKTDIKALCDCNAIYMLNNWTNSKGAEIERRIAIDLGMNVIYQKCK